MEYPSDDVLRHEDEAGLGWWVVLPAGALRDAPPPADGVNIHAALAGSNPLR
jgi:hypothetical protein